MMHTPSEDIELCAGALWDYLTVIDEPQQALAALVLGRDDMNIVRRSLELYQQGLAPLLVLLGGRGRLSGTLVGPESEAFRQFLLSQGVPDNAILHERESSNTTENIREGLRLLSGSLQAHRPVLLITHAPHARRALASATFQAPSTRFLSCPDRCSLSAIGSSQFRGMVEELVGEVARLIEYPELGYPVVAQQVPSSIQRCRVLAEAWLRNSPSQDSREDV